MKPIQSRSGILISARRNAAPSVLHVACASAVCRGRWRANSVALRLSAAAGHWAAASRRWRSCHAWSIPFWTRSTLVSRILYACYRCPFAPGAIAKHDMKLLSECTSLTGLGLAGTDVCDDDLWTIDDLRLLETLDLSDTRTGDESLRRIANHSALRILRVPRTGVSDAGLNALRSVPDSRCLTCPGRA